jgi:RNA 2',3'-cyclic 3'-phosphodiesterase
MSDATLRLFFALWPDDATRSALSACASKVVAQTGGREVAAGNLHLTLVFLGERPATLVPRLCQVAKLVPLSPMRLVLDEVGCWRKSNIAWLGPHAPDPSVLTLQSRLLDALTTIAIRLPESRFMPHVTLARKVVTRIALMLAQPVLWESASFALVSSELAPGGVRYRVIETWRSEV